MTTKANKILSRSLFLFHLGGSACNNCDIEILDALTPKYDLERFGFTAEDVRRDCAFVYDTFGVPKTRAAREETPTSASVSGK